MELSRFLPIFLKFPKFRKPIITNELVQVFIDFGSGSQTFFDATHLKKLTRLCDAPNSILRFSLPYCKINVTHNPHK